jgi:hypothetical protein
MRNGIVFICSWSILSLAVAVVTVSGNERAWSQGSKARSPESRGTLPERFRPKMSNALRVRTDTARGRIWVLALDDVRVYDAANKRLIRKMPLPDWTVARYICRPDMALDSSGSAVISSNIDTRLWRIDAESFELTERKITLHGREQWDVGFGALAFAADGTLLALTTFGGSLWRINIGNDSASIVEQNPSLLNRCELTTQFLNELERRRKP